MSKYRSYVVLFFILIIHVFLLSQLIYFPYQELFTYPYFTNSGLLPYKEVWDQHFPGLMFLPVNFATLGMTNEHVARIWSYVNVVLIQILIFFISKKLLKSDKKALFANILFLIWHPFFEGWVLWIDSFLPLFMLPAFYFSYEALRERTQKYFFYTGLFVGLGIVFKQVVIPLALLLGLVFLITKNIKGLFNYCLGLLPFPLLMLIYLASLQVLPEFWYWTISYNLTTFAELGKKYPTWSQFVRVAGVYGMSIFALFLKRNRLYLWMLVFIVVGLSSALARFDLVHFQPTLPFVAMASVFSWDSLKKNKIGLFIKPLYILGSIFLLFNFYKGHVGEKVFFFDEETKQIARKIEDLTTPNERIFIYGSTPHLYQMSNTLPAGDLYIQQYSWFFVVSEQQILESIVKSEPNLVVADMTVHVDGQNLIDYSPSIYKYIVNNYETVDSIGTTEFMIKK